MTRSRGTPASSAQLLLGTAARCADLGVRIIGDVLVALESERVAFLQREGLGVAEDRLRIGDGGTSFRLHEETGGDRVVAPGLQARDHRAVFGNGGDDVGNAEPLEDLAGDIRCSTGDLAIGSDGGKGRLVGDGDAREALLFQLLELVLVRGGWRGRSNCHQCGGACRHCHKISQFHRSQLLCSLDVFLEAMSAVRLRRGALPL
ncbi:hypothetical protein ACVINY_005804 [Sinorhizobium meliloti]